MPATDESKSSLYLRMATEIEERIASGDLRIGERLPSFGQMRKEYGANQVTLERVYAVLDKKGLIRREAKRGIFVAEPPAKGKPVIVVITRIDLQAHEYYIHLLQGIQEEAYRRGAEILLRRDDDLSDWKSQDGIIILTPTKEVRDCLAENAPHLPCVMANHKYPLEIASVVVDEETGIEASVKHLVSLGHQRIGYLTVEKIPDRYTPPPHRLEAYRGALLRAGIEPDSDWEWPLRLRDEVSRSFVDMGYEKMVMWLENGFAQSGCTALLAHNDEAAIGAIHALEDAGLRVPDDVSVVGFDGLLMGTRIRPQLTTVRVPLVEIGAAAVAAIMQCLEKREESTGAEKLQAKVASMTITPEFVERASTARVPQ